jgi:hypothetical protein
VTRNGTGSRWLALAAIIAVLCVAHQWWPQIRNEFFVVLGSRDEAGGWYGFNSGAAGAFFMNAIPFGLGLWWHHTCHVDACFLPGRHVVDGTRWCNRHHIDARRRLAATGSAHDLLLAA